ncbi:tetratricopeptide repeat protein [Marinilabilia rubra]|uniref:Uncharacterized protein n=1 Tax=Marinilabilia rubra TaxID=2162893 RepID=A0A2U2BAJ2_9BACT|nr:tetratricopeptide repeat protein [Marinilabilia rubra]PWE00053.1 hypothetical protein DDZ16_06745 [Marinilabilia rubra]
MKTLSTIIFSLILTSQFSSAVEFINADTTDTVTAVDTLTQINTPEILSPDIVSRRIEKARRLMKEYKIDRAIDLLEKTYSEDSSSVQLVKELEEIYYKTSENNKALELVNLLLKQGLDSSVYMPHKALILKKEGDFRASKPVFQSLIKADSTNTFFLNTIAEVYQDLGKTDSSLIFYTKSAETIPKSVTLYKAGKLLLGKERANEALNFMGNYYNPEIQQSKPLRRLIGQAFYLTDNIEKSIALFSELYTKGDSSFITTKFLGMSYRKDGQFIKGEEVLRIAAFQNPNDFLVFFNLGICCRKIGLVNESEKHFNTAMNLASTPLVVKVMINTELAETYEKQMRWEKALALYQEILEADPSNLSIRMKALFVLDYQIKDREQALNEYKVTLKMFEEDTTNSDHYNNQLKDYLKRRINKIEKEEFWKGGES